ncbi:MAG: DEAD/DEAH box helicase [Cyanobacteria bacterium SZAS LIN-2]|nr:DEAD/DEAH box helicase [Cyanobacteria bacterium SZAS LIN-3]MBS1996467.1 DEAD/DEAH box helicase [Cyanobacteria bacterium SZAS LIN-2]
MNIFAELGLSKPTILALEECEFVEPTEIQSKSIPLVLAGKDIMASAMTGSGKTAAYVLPIIELLKAHNPKPRVLVLVPTRELALQVESQVNRFGKNSKLRTVTLYGGTGYEKQNRLLRRGVDVIVATPGRLLDCVERRTADLTGIEILVLDEADRLLDMGFMPQVRRVVSQIPKKRQTLMLSATIDRRIEQLAGDLLTNPTRVQSVNKQVEPVAIEQKFFHVNEFGKDALLLKLIQESEMDSVLIFTKTRRKAAWVKDRLRDAQIAAEEIHGDISQSQREKTLKRYRDGAFAVLVATDVAARGLDIPTISHVVNYDLPESPEDYVHRIGRTGRAGRSGIAYSFVGENQRYLVRDIEKVIGRQLDENSQLHKTPARPFSRHRKPFKPAARRR